ncbi:7683_t:CDS:2 [Paraglomus brasilianum]|uniref:7683_t:CDS:1 n=1 Tax=Paraglomus brasilianum TaxID=144538 RepID=A0A9N9AF63_9GLOM|nr:7683_t:CDS:2 [Paraglomus brasilianum]
MELEHPDDGIDTFCTAIPKKEPVEGKLLLEPVRNLSRKPSKHWEDDDLMPLVKLLAGRPYIDGRGDNYEGANAFNMISPDFDAYLDKHDHIRGLIDPTYVVADVGGNEIPNFRLDNYPQTLPQPTAFGGTNYI